MLNLYVKNYWLEYPSIKYSIYLRSLKYSAKHFIQMYISFLVIKKTAYI